MIIRDSPVVTDTDTVSEHAEFEPQEEYEKELNFSGHLRMVCDDDCL